MSSTKPKADVTRAGRSKTQQAAEAALLAGAGEGATAVVDAPVLSQIRDMLEALKHDICGRIDASAATLREEVTSVRNELRGALEALNSRIEAHDQTIKGLEDACSDHDGRLSQIESTINAQTSQIKMLMDKCEDLEARSRRNNLRIVGLPEGLEGQRPTTFMAQLLMDLLGLDEAPLLDRAHRVSRTGSGAGGAPPRPLLIRVHFFHVRNEILRKASELSRSNPLRYQDKKLYIFADYTSAVAKKRAAFGLVKRELRTCPNVKFGLLYPATLKITTSDGISHTFDDPNAAKTFVDGSVKKQ